MTYYNDNQYDRYYRTNDAFASGPQGKSRGITALLAIFLGGIGIQYFYLNKVMPGLVFLIVGICTCGIVTSILSLIQGIMMLCMSNREFVSKYVLTASSFPLF